VGTGIAGLIIADKLPEKYRIALVESGDYCFDKKINELNEFESTGHPMRSDFFNRIRQYGGACNLWAGRCMTLTDADFEHRHWIGQSGWPISGEELRLYYRKLSRDYGFVDDDYFEDAKYIQSTDSLATDIFRNKDLNAAVALWSKITPRFGQGSDLYKRLCKRKNITVFLRSTVSDFISSEHETVGCNVVRFDGSRYKIAAQTYILAAGGIENARVLLSSKTPMGYSLGNKFDHVGRYFMDHPTATRSDIKLIKRLNPTSIFEHPTSIGKLKLGVKLSHLIQEKFHFSNPYIEFSPQYPRMYEDSFAKFVEVVKFFKSGNFPKNPLSIDLKNLSQLPEIIYLLSPSEIFPHWFTFINYEIGKFFRRSPICTSLVVSHHLEQLPDKDSRICLRNELNLIGINKININWKINSIDVESAEFLEWHVINQLISTGWISRETQKSTLDIFRDASHHMGTTRMSSNYEDGVVDLNCKIHENRNLFVIGSSVFPVSAHANPTYTIGAISLRLAEYLDHNHENFLH
jgi:choline dehydrogenase-like flavoprotein